MFTKIKKSSFLAVVLFVAIGLMALTATAQRNMGQAIVPTVPPIVPTVPPITPPGQGIVPPGQPFQALQAEIVALQTLIQANLISNHFKEITFSLAPGASFSFALPKKQVPVRIEITFTLENAGTQKPSEIMYAVVNQDPVSNQMTWVGTNNDASSQASTTLTGMVIANIFGGAAPTVNASLMVDDLATSMLKVFQDSLTTSATGHYVVHLWF